MKTIIKKISTISLVAALLIGQTGCKKFLDKNPDNRADLATGQNISQLLSTAYPRASYITLLESASDNVGDRGVTEAQTINNINIQPYWYENVESTAEDSPEFYWAGAWKAVAAANQALEAISKSENPQQFNAQKGEALLCRAYIHFMLTSIFAPVYDPATNNATLAIPYMEVPETELFVKHKRLTVKELFEKIEKDLTTGLPLLDNNTYAVPKYHFTSTAAHAFATRFYLFKKEWDKVIEHANAAFPTNNFADVMRPWTTTYKNYTADEFLSIYARATESANLLLSETNSRWAREYGTYRFGLTPEIRTKTVTGPNATGGSWAYSTYYQGGDQNNVLILKFNEFFVRTHVNADIGDLYMMVPLFTVEEVLLNRAEAYISSAKEDLGLKDLNTYASKRIQNYNATGHALTEAKVTNYYALDYNEALLQTLLDFKRNEFMQEGLRWFDLQRHKITITHSDKSGNRTIEIKPDDPKRVFKLPATAFQGFSN